MKTLPLLAFALPLLSAWGGAGAEELSEAPWPCWRGPARDGVSRETGWASAGHAESLWSAHVGLGHTSSVVAGGCLFTVGFEGSGEVDEAGEPTGVDRVVCLDALTGTERWRVTYPTLLLAKEHGGGSLSTPAFDGGQLFVLNREGVLRCLDSASGELLWLTDFRAEYDAAYKRYGFASSPVVIGDLVYINVDCALALDRETGNIVWKTELLDANYSTPAPFRLRGQDCLAVFGSTGLHVLVREDGTSLYQHPWRQGGRNVEGATPVVVGEQIFLSSAYDHGGALFAFADGKVETVFQTRDMRTKMAGSVYHEEHFYGFDESMLKCINLAGEEQWRKRGLGNGALMIADDRLLIMSSKGELLVAAATPEEYRELAGSKVLDGGVYWSAPVLADGLIYCRSSLGDLVCRDHRPRGQLAERRGTEAARGEGEAALPAAADLFERHLTLVGGKEALRAHPALVLRGAFEALAVGLVPTQGEIHWMAPDLFSTRITLPPELGGGFVIESFDGTHGFSVDLRRGSKLRDAERTEELRAMGDFLVEAEYDERFARLQTLARLPFDDRDCYEVEAELPGGGLSRFYFDAATGLLAGRGGEGESILVFRDYREFDGRRLAMFRKEFEADTGIERTWRFEAVDDAVDAALFVMPDDVKAALAAEAAAEEPARR